MFDLSKEELRQLSDSELREVAALLCESELREAGQPVSSVKVGGSQNAPDGGLDVEVNISGKTYSGDFVPCARTGIQVKKSSMPASKIENEMSPQGELRPIFTTLAKEKGCYIIISLEDDYPSQSPGARKRRAAMQNQLLSMNGKESLRTEFYGPSELESWLRQHPGVQLRVRKILAKPLEGWKPLGKWTTVPPQVDDKLICGSGVTIFFPGSKLNKLDIVTGIVELRKLVKQTNDSVRIVGLSGVGKTRIIQALFEEEVGNDPLDKNLAMYADLSDEPKPSVQDFVNNLVTENRSAIIILDNCSSSSHAKFSNLVLSYPKIRLVTIEYDIREDKPEYTTVVRIEAEGAEIAESLVNRRYPKLGQINAQRIAEFAGGNSRLSLALANSAPQKDNLSNLSDEQLFERLFYQKNKNDDKFSRIAEVLSLVYSFSVSKEESGVDELSVLANLIEDKRLTLCRVTQELIDRQLAQKRGNWRAILPHAVSNRLAAKALNYIPIEDIQKTFERLGNKRLLKSLAKRLGYLHDHEKARRIASSWLLPGGILYDLEKLDKDNLQILLNIAPTVPEAILKRLKQIDEDGTNGAFFSYQNSHQYDFVNLLIMIAYESDFFERSVDLLAKFALVGKESGMSNDVSDRLFSLFSIYLYQTETSLEVRERVVKRFISSKNKNEPVAGLRHDKRSTR